MSATLNKEQNQPIKIKHKKHRKATKKKENYNNYCSIDMISITCMSFMPP